MLTNIYTNIPSYSIRLICTLLQSLLVYTDYSLTQQQELFLILRFALFTLVFVERFATRSFNLCVIVSYIFYSFMYRKLKETLCVQETIISSSSLSGSESEHSPGGT